MKEIKKIALILVMMICWTMLEITVATAQSPVGAYRSISAKDKEVVNAAKFAVRAEQEKNGEKFTGLKVLKAQRQVVRGFNYKMCLSVKENGTRKTAEAVVNSFMKKYELLSWVWKDCR